MFIVKLIRYEKAADGQNVPVKDLGITLRECAAVHTYYDSLVRQIVQLGDAPGDTMEITIGDREDCSYRMAYIMNSQGKTVETVR